MRDDRFGRRIHLPGGQSLDISTSIGVAVYPDHGADESQLLSNADRALYMAKAQGRNRVQLFQPA
ncbi:MAG: diguanylate cyclase [Burkholderiales bacterium]